MAVDDVDLATVACNRILGKLAILSEVSAVAVHIPRYTRKAEPRLSRNTTVHMPPASESRPGESQVPTGVDMNRTVRKTEDRAPSKRQSLYYHYRWRMERAAQARDAHALLTLAAMAQRDYLGHMGAWRREGYEYHKDAVKALLADWVGCPSAEVAIWLAVPEKWVRKERLINGRDPQTGEDRIPDERTDKIVAMMKEGLTQQGIADRLRLHKTTVHRILTAS